MHTTKKALPSWHQQAILVSYRNSVLYLRRRISRQINMIRSERGITTHDSDITYPKGSFRQKLLQRILFRFFRTKCVCNYTPARMFLFENAEFNSLLWNSLVSYLNFQLGYSAGLFQASWLIVLAVFEVVDQQYTHTQIYWVNFSGMLV